jgi:hypothetical protein
MFLREINWGSKKEPPKDWQNMGEDRLLSPYAAFVTGNVLTLQSIQKSTWTGKR